MPKPWKQIEQEAEYQNLSTGEKRQFRDYYFKNAIEPNFTQPADKEWARQEFVNRVGIPDESTYGEMATKWVENAPKSVVGGVYGANRAILESGNTDIRLAKQQKIAEDIQKLQAEKPTNYADKILIGQDLYGKQLESVLTDSQYLAAYPFTLPTVIADSMTGANTLEDVSAIQQEAMQQVAENQPTIDEQLSLKGVVNVAGSSLVEQVPFMGLAAMTGGAGMALVPMSTISTGRAYGEQRAAGRDPYEAFLPSVVSGGAEYLGEKMPVEELLKTGGGLAKRIGRTALAESIGEGLITSPIQSAVDAATINPDMTFGEAAQDAALSALAGGAAGGAMATPAHGINIVRERDRENRDQRARERVQQKITDQFNQQAGQAALPDVTSYVPRKEPVITTMTQEGEAVAPVDMPTVAAPEAAAPTPEEPPIVTEQEIEQLLNTDIDVQELVRNTEGYALINADTGDNTEVQGQVWWNPDTGDIKPYVQEGVEPAPAPTMDAIVDQAIKTTGTKKNPVVVETSGDLDIADSQVNEQPTEPQKAAGNYKKAHIKWQGYDISIESPKGGLRSGVDSDGETWQTEMPVSYGYIKKTKGGDLENIDVFMGDVPESRSVYLIKQQDPDTGEYDEDKLLIGFNSADDAEQAYIDSFSDGKGGKRIQSFEEIRIESLSDYLGEQTEINKVTEQAVDQKTPNTPITAVSSIDGDASPEIKLASDLLAGTRFRNITEAQKRYEEITGTKVTPQSEDAKVAEEVIEQAYVLASRSIVESGRFHNDSPEAIYDNLVDLYQSQPGLNTRTGESRRLQAYSTPSPIAYLASELAGITYQTPSVYEPTAGHGMLLTGASPQAMVANELDTARYNFLKKHFGSVATVSNLDALNNQVPPRSMNAVIANPPFGKVKDSKGENITFRHPLLDTTEIDQAISMKSLEAMRDDGTAVLIIGSKAFMAATPEARRKKYQTPSARKFFGVLYDNYNVVNHITVDGKLYSKQGAGFPIDIIVINGRGQSKILKPGGVAPRYFKSFEELRSLFDGRENPIQSEASESFSQNPVGNIQPEGTEAGSGQAPVSLAGGSQTGASDGANIDDNAQGDAGGVRKPDAITGAVAGESDVLANVADGDSAVSVGDRGSAVSGATGGDTATSNAGRPEQPRRSNEPDSGLSNDLSGRVEEVTEDQLQVAYKPLSKANTLETLMPAKMQSAMYNALQSVEARVGKIDAWVAEKLEFTVAELHKVLAAEQIDAVALALDNISRGEGFILADQTGVGKGRVVASLLRYARLTGKTPIFVTEKPTLYADMYRDLSAIGEKNINAFITNEDLRGRDEDGNEKKMFVEETGSYIESMTAGQYKKAVDSIIKERRLPEGNNYFFTTYSQLQPVKGKKTRRQELIEELQYSPNIVVFDESHNAGGFNDPKNNIKVEYAGRGNFARFMSSHASGVVFSSATYAKNPATMSLYSRTALGRAVKDTEGLKDILTAGGVPLQQVLANMLVEAGQLARREKSYEGIRMDFLEVGTNEATADKMANVIENIFTFDSMLGTVREQIDQQNGGKGGSVGADNAIGQDGIVSSNFTSVLHNLVNQMLMALSVKEMTTKVIESVKNGEKVVIALANTNETFLSRYSEQNNIAVGGELKGLNINQFFMNYLRRTRVYTLKNQDGTKEEMYITDEELGEDLTLIYNITRDAILNADLENLPVSPIDYVHSELQKVGIKSGEVTGRSQIIEYKDGKQYLASKASSPAIRKAQVRKFQAGEIDVIILNQSGSTGISLHASKDAKDQKPRRMFVLQADPNIDTFMQMLGRINRTGQVNKPGFNLVVTNLPAQKRPAAILMKKLASLNANTTANKKSAVTLDTVVDFMNKYGDEVIAELASDEPELLRSLGIFISKDEGEEGLSRKFTGRLAIKTIAEQRRIYDLIENNYKEKMAYLDSIGENTLEAKTLDLRTEDISQEVFVRGNGSRGIFGADAILKKVKARRLGKPYRYEKVEEMVAEILNERSPREFSQEIIDQHEQETKDEVMRLASKARESGDNKDAQRLQAAKDALYEVRQFLTQHPVGSRVVLKTDTGNVHGIVLDITRDKTKAPTAYGKFKYRLALGDSRREIKVPLSQMKNPPGVKKESKFILEQSYYDDEGMRSLFNEQQSDVMEERYIIVGNLIAGYERAGKGSVTFYTDSNGKVHNGILMPKAFDPVEAAKNDPVYFENHKELSEYVDQALLRSGRNDKVIISTADDLVKIEITDTVIEFNVVVRGGGSKYATDRMVKEITGKTFVGSKKSTEMYFSLSEYTDNNMKANALKLIKHWMESFGANFKTTQNKQILQEMRGESDVRFMRRQKNAQSTMVVPGNNGVPMGIRHVLNDKYQKRRSIAEKVLKSKANQMFKGVSVTVVDQIIDESTGISQPAYFTTRRLPGGYVDYMMVISLEMFKDDSAGYATRLGHEGIHFLRRIGAFSDQDWISLERMAIDTWIDRHDIKKRYASNPEVWVEEAIAEAYGEWFAGETQREKGRNPDAKTAVDDSLVVRVFNSLKRFFRAIHDWLMKQDIRDFSDIFEDIYFGDLKNPSVLGSLSEDALLPATVLYQQNTVQPVFYSALIRAVEQARQDKATPEQWRGIIANTPGVKSEEREWTGVDVWLSEQQGSVTRESLVAFLKENEVVIEEVLKADSENRDEIAKRIYDSTGYVVHEGTSVAELRREEIGEDLIDKWYAAFIATSAPKYFDQTLPGGKNYRELLLTMPIKDAVDVFDKNKVTLERKRRSTTQGSVTIYYDGKKLETYEDAFEINPQTKEYEGQPDDRWIQSAKRLFESGSFDRKILPISGAFKSSHYDEPNILAHVRFNERYDEDGNRVLFIEEIQSDWHQEGRKKGYNTPAEWSAHWSNPDAIVTPIGEHYYIIKPEEGGGFELIKTGEGYSEIFDTMEAAKEAASKGLRNFTAAGGVPDAPFKKSWHELSMKRMIRWAAENGFDKVAWTTGQVQAERNNLVRHVNKIAVPMINENDRSVRIDAKEGTSFKLMVDNNGVVDGSYSSGQFSGKQLSEVVGVEIAERIMALSEPAEFSGNDLEIGGEGMKGFYDKILLDFTKKYIKRWGGKIGTTEFVLGKGSPSTKDRKFVESHSFEITPDMKKAVLFGQPMFQKKKTPPKKKRPATNKVIPIKIQADDANLYDTLVNSHISLHEKMSAVVDRSQWVTMFDAMRLRLQDYFLPFARLQEQIENKTGEEIPDYANIYLHEETYTGKVKYQLDVLSREKLRPLYDKIAAFSEEYGKDMRYVEIYLIAKHARERNARVAQINPEKADGGSGMTNNEANAFLSQVKQEGTLDALESIYKDVRKILDDALDTSLARGLIKKELFDQLKKTFKDYIPLRGVSEIDADMIDESKDTGVRVSRGYQTKGKEIVRIKTGRDSLPADVFAHILAISQQAIIRGEKARVAQAAYALVKKYPDKDFWEISAPHVEPRLNKQTGLIEYRATEMPKNLQLKDNAIVVKVGGVQKIIVFKDMKFAEAMRGIGYDNTNVMIKMMTLYMRYLSAVMTRYNAEFMISNAIRDWESAGINLLAEEKFNKKQIINTLKKDYYPSLIASWVGQNGVQSVSEISPAMRKLLAAAGVDVKSAASMNKGLNYYLKKYQEFAAAGGQVAWFTVDDIATKRKKMRKEMESYKKKGLKEIPKTVFMAIVDYIEAMNNGVEQALRVSAFINAQKAGYTDLKAASIAKNVTVNFNRRGQWGTWISAAYLFGNASIQGAARVLTSLRKSPRARKAAMSLIVMGLVQELLNGVISAVDDDGELEYDKIPESVKEANFLIALPGKIESEFARDILPIEKFGNIEALALPMFYGWRFFHNIGRNSGAFMRGRKSVAQSAGDLIKSFMINLNPIGGYDSFLNVVSPTLLDGLIAVESNRNYFDDTIYPADNPFDKTPPPDAYSYKYSATEQSKWVAQALNDMTGGSEFEEGGISVHPDTLDYLVKNYVTGSAGAFFSRIGNMAVDVAKNEPIEIREVPFFRRVMIGTSSYADIDAAQRRSSEVISVFERYKGMVQDGYPAEERKEFVDDHKKVLALSGMQMQRRKRGEAPAIGTAAHYEYMRKNLNKQRRAIYRNEALGFKKKSELLQDIRRKEVALATSFNRSYLKTMGLSGEKTRYPFQFILDKGE